MTQSALQSDRSLGRNDTCFCGSGRKHKRCCLLRASPSPRIPPGVEEMLRTATTQHQAGCLAEAAQLYGQILALNPKHADALFFGGILAHQRGDAETALRSMRLAIAEDPARALFRLNLGVVLQALGRGSEAIASFREAITLDPQSDAAHYNLGEALWRENLLGEAAASFSRALSLRPQSHEAANGLGSVLQKVGRLDQAVTCFRKAISLCPNYAEAHNNLGNALDALGRLDEAIASFRNALAVRPDFAEAHSNLGNTLRARGHVEEAIESCRRALAYRPGYPEALLNLGNAQKEQGRLAAAVEIYREVLRLEPNHVGAYNNLAETFKDQGSIPEAAACFERAMELTSQSPTAYSNLLYLHAFTRDISPEAERLLATGWERVVLTETERVAARQRASVHSGVFPRAGRRLRVGIASAELGTHAVAEFLEPFLKQLDRSRFHLTLFPTVGRSGDRAERLRELADSWVSLIGLSDRKAAEKIRSEQIDVLIDTTGHTNGCRLGIFAHRAAPVQCTYIGYWSTTGLTEMDWFLSDPDCQPSCDAHFTEGLWRLPRIAVCYRGDHALPESRWQPDPDGTVWLGSYNKYAKIREETLALWARVLGEIPHAKLLLEDRAVDETETHNRIRTALQQQGVSPDRVEFISYVPGHERHMVLYDRLDIALDTVPFNSGTTAFDALWMGVPLVALEGDWIGGRMASSVLKTLGRPEWVAQSQEQYVEIVSSLASNTRLRQTIRQAQRAEMASSELCDAEGLTRALENAFEGMYDRWIAGEETIPVCPPV